MPILFEDIQKRIESPKYKDQILEAIQHESKVTMHTQVKLNQYFRSYAVTEFLDMVESILENKPKFRLFLSMFRFPVETNVTTGMIFDAMEKVFDSRDMTVSHEFTSETDAADWAEVREKFDNFRAEFWEAYKSEFNSVLVVDLPSEQTTERPEPYINFIPLDHVVDLEFSDRRHKKIEWIIFKDGDDRLSVYDDQSFRVFPYLAGKLQPTPIIDNFHDLGYCPATFLIDEPVERYKPVVKEHIFTKFITNLNWLLYWMIGKKNLDNYAAYPIFSTFESECDFADPVSGSYCENGYLKDSQNHYLIEQETLTRCPLCAQRKYAGVGSLVEVPVPNQDNDFADLRNPVSVTTIDRNSLDYNVAEMQRQEDVIFSNITGGSKDLINDQAINDVQVTATFEDRTRSIRKLARKIEAVHTWVEKTICRLRYGSSFISASINYGNEFYLYPAAVLNKLYDEARKQGRPSWQLDQLEDELIMTKFKHDPSTAVRLKIIKNLDPFRHKSDDQVLEMMNRGLVNREDALIKVNLSSLILRFERENMSIVEFGSESEFDTKINSIYQTLLTYVREEDPEQSSDEDEGMNPGQASQNSE
jgi:hypothetical protein